LYEKLKNQKLLKNINENLRNEKFNKSNKKIHWEMSAIDQTEEKCQD
jgi:hypothetical protein